MNLKNKTIAFIPPNGEVIKQDFALYRIISYFESKGVKTFLLIVNNGNQNDLLHYNTSIIHLKDKNEIFTHLKNNKYDLIFSRSWMHRYSFGAKIAKEFDNVVSHIKDWHDFPKDEYAYIYKSPADFDGILEIFKYSKLVLSHYSDEYLKFLYKKYNIDKTQNYLFSPDYTIKNNFYTTKNKSYSLDTAKIILAGGGAHSSLPGKIAPMKSLLFTMTQLADQKIYVDQVVLKKHFEKIQNNTVLYEDLLYEDKFNPFFSLKLGSELDSSLGEKYHFGIFADSNYQANNLFERAESYGVTSKFAFYMECGLPVLVNKRFKTLSKIVETNKIGITFVDDDLKDFKKLLDISQTKYNKLIKNVYKFREKFTYNSETMKPIFEMLS